MALKRLRSVLARITRDRGILQGVHPSFIHTFLYERRTSSPEHNPFIELRHLSIIDVALALEFTLRQVCAALLGFQRLRIVSPFAAEEEERGRMASAKPEILRKYLDLEQPDDVVFVTYVFVDGTLENVRAKTRTLAFEPKTAKSTLQAGNLNVVEFICSNQFRRLKPRKKSSLLRFLSFTS